MARLRVEAFTISLDGFGAGPAQSLHHPLGVNGQELHQWLFPTDTLQRILFGKSGVRNADDRYAARGFENIGAGIMGRNMFGPVRGPWPDDSWKGWWGDKPPYQVPVFVLTHHPRPPLAMAGGMVFHFVTGGIHDALEKARVAAGDRDIRLNGGVSTVRQYLLAGIDLRAPGYRCVEHVPTEQATHLVLRKGG